MTQALQRNYTDPQITVALEVLAAHSGNLAATKRQLDEEGLEIPKDRLKRWARTEHPEKYREARIKQAERVKEFLADKHHAAAIRDLEIEERATEKLRAKMEAETLSDKDLLGLKGKAGLGSAIHTDKGQQLDADPIVQAPTNLMQIQINLERKGIKIAMPGEELEGEAEEID